MFADVRKFQTLRALGQNCQVTIDLVFIGSERPLRLTGPFTVATVNALKIAFDPHKDAVNQAKHGVSLPLAAELDWEAALVWVDDRFDYNELRMIAFALEANVLYYVAFVDRDEVRRVISLRRANRREVKHYVKNI